MDALWELTARQMTDAARTGRIGAGEIAAACLDRLAARDHLVRAWVYADRPLVLAQARELDAAQRNGDLLGVPIGVKDVIHTRDMPTQHNSPHYRGGFAHIDAACVAVLRAAGAVILGKTDTVEFAATGRKALTRNPWDLRRTPGGSSSGSAAAVADRHVPIALGTQTGGSIVRPASYCGVFGFKPTWGLVSTEGAKTFAPSLDTIGWFATCADDLQLIYDVFDPALEPAFADRLVLSGSRIALCRSPAWESAEAGAREAMAAAAAALREAGAQVVDLELPPVFDRLGEAHAVIMATEGRSSFLSEHRLYGEALHPNLRAYVENVGGHTRPSLLKAYDVAAACRPMFDEIAGAFDAVVTPSSVGEAPLGLAETGAMTFNAMWTLLHVPCVNTPGFTGPAGMPVGLTVTGPRFSDRAVLAAAAPIAEAFKAFNLRGSR